MKAFLRLLTILSLYIFGSLAVAKTPDYALLDDVLAGNVRNGYVDYDGIAADARFAEFLDQLADAKPEDLSSDDEFFAFYVNAYNAFAIRGILDGYSPSNAWGRRKFFKKAEFDLLGAKITLDEIEHGLLRPRGDARIHFAIVCASMSCPRLSSRAYTPDKLDEQLHEAAVQFINDPTRNRFDSKRQIAFLSQIFNWFEEDFEQAAGSVQKYVARFVKDADAEDLLRAEDMKIRYEDYDWNLNGYYGAAEK